MTYFLLQENSDKLLQETGEHILLEEYPPTTSSTSTSTSTTSTTSSTTTQFIPYTTEAATIVPILEVVRTYRQWT